MRGESDGGVEVDRGGGRKGEGIGRRSGAVSILGQE